MGHFLGAREMDKAAEHQLPVRAYDVLDNALSTIWLTLGKDLSKESHPDPRAGRTDMGTTYEDFHLFWPLRPRTWFDYPKENTEDSTLFSRDHLMLREEQKAYRETANAVFLGRGAGTTAHQVCANKIHSAGQKELAGVYQTDIDIRSPMKDKQTYPLGLSDVRLQEFWDDRLADRDVGDRVRRVQQVSAATFAAVTTYTAYALWTPTTRVLAVPIGLLTGYLSTISAITLMEPLTETEGLNKERWERTVKDGVRRYAERTGTQLEAEQAPATDVLFKFQPFRNPFASRN